MSQDTVEQHHSSFQSIDPRDIPYANIGTIESILSNPLTSEATKLLCTYRLTFIKHYEQQQNSIIQQATNHRKQAEIDWIWSKLLEEQQNHTTMNAVSEDHIHPNLNHVLKHVTDYVILKTIADHILHYCYNDFCDSIFDNILVKTRELADMAGITTYGPDED